MNQSKIILSAIIILVASLTFGFQNSSDHKVLFEKAKFTMETKGDLKGAIKLFEQILAKYPNQRGYAARSQLYIGHCYEKLGLKQAQEAYQLVVDEFPEQKEAVKVAREKLSLLRQMEAMSESDRKDFRMSKVLDGWGKVSPDGRFIALTNNKTGNISIYEISTGKKREINLGGNTKSANPQFVAFVAWSPDGKTLVYSWHENMKHDLRVVDLAGGDPSVLYQSDDIDYIVPVDWSPDGTSILIAGSGKATSGGPAIFSIKEQTLELIEIGNGDQDWKIEDSVGFSPNGKYILFTIIAHSESRQKDIFLYSLSEKQVTPLIESPSDDKALGWTVDGKYLLYTSDRTGTADLWMSEVVAGKAVGNPILIKKNIGSIEPVSISKDGALFYLLRTGFVDVKITEVDIEKGESLSDSFSVSEWYLGANTWPKWSPDGKQLLYVSERRKGSKGAGSKVLCIYTLDTKEVKELNPALKYMRLGIWAPDGKSLLVVGGDNDDVHGLHKVDAATGHTSLVFEYNDNTGIHSPVYTQDGKKIYFRSFKWNHLYSERNYKIRSYELDTKKDEILFTTKPETAAYLYDLALSPDESQISFFTQSIKPICTILYIMPSQGGEPKEILRYVPPEAIVQQNWTPDGQNLILAIGNWNTGAVKLYKVSIESGQTEYLGVEADFLHNFSLHPDGKYLAFASGKAMWEIWVMENFIPQDINK